MIMARVARILLKVPIMMEQPDADGSISPCVAVTHFDGTSVDVICVMESDITKPPENFNSDFQQIHMQHG